MVCVRIVWWTFWRGGIFFGALLGAAFGTLIFPLLGTLYGLFYGALLGTITGAVDAFALGAIAHFFMDMQHPSRVVPWLRLVSVPLTFIVTFICCTVLFGESIRLIVSLIAIVPPYFLCPRFVKYAVRIQQPDPHPVPKTVTSPIVW